MKKSENKAQVVLGKIVREEAATKIKGRTSQGQQEEDSHSRSRLLPKSVATGGGQSSTKHGVKLRAHI